MMNTVAVIGAGIGALSLGFEEAGFQIIAAFEKEKKAFDNYKRNIGGAIYEDGLPELSPEKIPNADVIAFDLARIPSLNDSHSYDSKGYRNGMGYLAKVQAIITEKYPPAFCLVMKVGMHKGFAMSGFTEAMSRKGYKVAWNSISSSEAGKACSIYFCRGSREKTE